MSKCNIEDILEFAIADEMSASRFYLDMASKTKDPAMVKVFEEFAKEEQGHKAKLQAIKQDKTLAVMNNTLANVANLKIADYTVDVSPNAEMDYQQALILAMKKEKAAYKLYSDLAQSIEDEDLSKMFLFLAQEEAKHKLRFEIEYDDEILKEN